MGNIIQSFSVFQCGKIGDLDAVAESRRIVFDLKRGKMDFLQDRLKMDDSILSPIITPDSTLVPIPRSAPFRDSIGLSIWPSLEICKTLDQFATVESIQPVLRRVFPVKKSAFQNSSDERTTVREHYNSLGVENSGLLVATIRKIILVDDYLTQGRTAYACYCRLRELFSDIPIGLFTVCRSAYRTPIDRTYFPKITEIKYNPNSGKTTHVINPL